MNDFKLDTSGLIDTAGHFDFVRADGCTTRFVAWQDLSPFAQGYVEAMPWGELENDRAIQAAGWRWVPSINGYKHADGREYPDFDAEGLEIPPAAFTWLAPETLVRIIEDCAYLQSCIHSDIAARQETGALVWRDRQAGAWSDAGYAPLTVSLGDDGNVRLS